jgi:arylsulfatase A-like enzyme
MSPICRRHMVSKIYCNTTRTVLTYGLLGGYPKFIEEGLNERWLPVFLQDAGYNTYYTGKLFNAHDTENYDKPYPKGFTAHDFLLDPFTYQYLNSSWQRNQEKPVNRLGEYSTDILAEKAYGFLKDGVEGDKPFFLGIAPVAPHSNVQAVSHDLLDPNNNFIVGPPVSAKRHEHLFKDLKIPRKSNFNPDKVGYQVQYLEKS